MTLYARQTALKNRNLKAGVKKKINLVLVFVYMILMMMMMMLRIANRNVIIIIKKRKINECMKSNE